MLGNLIQRNGQNVELATNQGKGVLSMAGVVTSVRPGAADGLVSASYDRFASSCAIGAGAAAFLYSVAFVVLHSDVLSALCLLLVGLLSVPVLVSVYGRLRATDGSFALWALILGMGGALGSAVHGGYDLANGLHPPANLNVDLPSQIDPRGLLTFGVTGLGVWVVAWLIVKSGRLPKALGYLGYVSGTLLIVLYLARLIVLDANSPLVLLPALISGFLAGPAWYIWVGLVLRRPVGWRLS